MFDIILWEKYFLFYGILIDLIILYFFAIFYRIVEYYYLIFMVDSSGGFDVIYINL